MEEFVLLLSPFIENLGPGALGLIVGGFAVYTIMSKKPSEAKKDWATKEDIAAVNRRIDNLTKQNDKEHHELQSDFKEMKDDIQSGFRRIADSVKDLREEVQEVNKKVSFLEGQQSKEK